MRVLVTGATGFIGNYVVEELLKRGHSVIASSSKEENAKKTAWYHRVDFIPLDLSEVEPEKNYFEYFKKPQVLIHLTWEGLPNYRSTAHLTEYLPRQQTFLLNLVRHGLLDLTVTGTCFEYGMQSGQLKETMPALPENPYGIAKNELRQYLEGLQQQFPFSLKWVRLFYMYGKGQNPNSLLSQLDRALELGEQQFNMSGGEQVRDFLPVEKVAEYIVEIALQKKISGVINCCSNKPVRVKEFVKNYLHKINKTIPLNLGYYPYPDYEPMEFWGDDEKLKSILLHD